MTRTCQDRPYGRGPVEVIDCERHGRGSGAELFVVEGESAALAVARERDPRTQAVLAMQGKPLNALKASPRRVASQPLFRALAAALGTGMGDDFRGDRLRFDRLLILTDPDADGIHCGVLLLALLQSAFRPLLEAPPEKGIVFWVRAPWGEVAPADGSPALVAHSEEGLVALVEEVRRRQPATMRRFRGLAAIDSGLLARHCVAAESRRADAIDARQVAGMLALLAAAGADRGGLGGSGDR